jgi:hypothetical protein
VPEESGVCLDEQLFVFREVVGCENRIGGACRNAGATVDALGWVDKQLSCFFETGLILFGMDAIGWANSTHSESLIQESVST